MPSVEKNTKIKEWEVIISFVSSGVLYWTLLSYPFALEKQAGWFYLGGQLCVSLIAVVPILIVELGVGQLNQTGLFRTWGEIVPLFKGIGLTSTVVSIYLLGTINFTTSLGVYYFSKCVYSGPPWTASTENATTNQKIPQNAGMFYRNVAFITVDNLEDELGTPHLHLLLCLFFIWLAVCILQIIAVKYTCIIPYLLIVLCTFPISIILLLIFGAVWNGAVPIVFGWNESSLRVLWDPEFWINTILQSFIYLPLGLGTCVRLASRSDTRNNITRIATVSILFGVIIEKAIGILYYTIMNHLAELKGQTPDSLHRVGFGTIFVTFPDYFSNLASGSQQLLLLYFTLLMLICISSLLMMARGLKGALLEMFPTIPEALAIVIVSICGFTTGIPFLTPHGKMLIYVVQTYAIRPMKVLLVCLEVTAIYIYKIKKFRIDLEYMNDNQIDLRTKLSWMTFIPISLIVALVGLAINSQLFFYNGIALPMWAAVLGYSILAIVILCITIPAIYEACKIYRQPVGSSSSLSMLKIVKMTLINKDTVGLKDEHDRRKWRNFRASKLLEARTDDPTELEYWV